MSASKAVGSASIAAGTLQVYTFDKPVKHARVTLLPLAAGPLYGRWNSDTASLTDFDFYLPQGDYEISWPYDRIKQVALYAPSLLTYETDFSVRGILPLG